MMVTVRAIAIMMIITSGIAADPPTPDLADAFSCIYNLSTVGGGISQGGDGSVQIDSAGKGKQRTMTAVFTRSAAMSFDMVIENIQDFVSGNSWTRTCSNMTGTTSCSCSRSDLSGHMVYQDTSDWDYVGEATIDGELCTQWLSTGANYFVTKNKPFLIRKMLTKASGRTTTETMGNYTLGPPPPSTWAPPSDWDCKGGFIEVSSPPPAVGSVHESIVTSVHQHASMILLK